MKYFLFFIFLPLFLFAQWETRDAWDSWISKYNTDVIPPSAGTITGIIAENDTLSATWNLADDAINVKIYLSEPDNADSVLWYSGSATSANTKIPFDLKWAANENLYITKYSYDASDNRSSAAKDTILPSYFTIWTDTATTEYATIYRAENVDSASNMQDSAYTDTMRIYYEDWITSGWGNDSLGLAIADTNASDTSWYHAGYDSVSGSNWAMWPEVSSSGAGVVTYGGFSSAQATDVTLSIAVPTGVANGDILICTVASDVDQTITLPTGWTLITELTSSSHRQALAYKIASSESGSYTFTIATSTGFAGIVSYYNKTSGTWNIANYTTATVTASGTITNSAINVLDGSILYLSASSDGAYVDLDPPGTTRIAEEFVAGATVSTTAFYEEYSFGDTGITKIIVYNASEDHALTALEIKAE